MQLRKPLVGTGTVLAVLSVGFAAIRGGPSQDLFLHDVYVFVAPLHILILSLLLSGIAALGSHFTPHSFNRLLALASLAVTASSSVVFTAAGALRWDFPRHPWLLHGLFLADVFLVLGFALFSISLLWTLLWNALRIARMRFS
jgi:hypothetical protein